MSCHSEQLDEVEALQAIYHEDVEILCDDEGLLACMYHDVRQWIKTSL